VRDPWHGSNRSMCTSVIFVIASRLPAHSAKAGCATPLRLALQVQPNSPCEEGCCSRDYEQDATRLPATLLTGHHAACATTDGRLFTLCVWRSTYVPHGKGARALPSRIRSVVRHRRKRSHKLSGINCVAATIQLAGQKPATLDRSVDRRFGNACGPCCAAWCIALSVRCAKTLLVMFPCSR
jgi:hypothetical protein